MIDQVVRIRPVSFSMKTRRFIKRVLCFLACCTLFISCTPEDSEGVYQPTFVADTSNIKTLVWGFPSFSYCENADLIVKYLNENLKGAHIVVQACASWDTYVDFLKQNRFDITLVNGIQAVDATTDGYTIYGKIMDDSQYSGIVVTRKDAHIKEVSDLKGKTIAMGSSDMIPGTMMPLYYLYERGLNVNSEIKKLNVASFESAIMAVYLGDSDAGLSMKRNWIVYQRDHPEVLDKVELKWETPPLINNALVVNNNVDKEMTAQLLSLFFLMHTTKEGKEALSRLNITGFEKANSDTYKPMLDFKMKYDAVIID